MAKDRAYAGGGQAGAAAIGVRYAFDSAQRLLEDVFAEVDRVIKGAHQ